MVAMLATPKIILGTTKNFYHFLPVCDLKQERKACLKKKLGKGGYKLAKVRVWHGEEKTKKPQEQKTPQQKDADSFLSGHKVRIHFLMSGHDPMEGILVHVGKFQLVLKTDDGINNVIYKHAVERIEPQQ